MNDVVEKLHKVGQLAEAAGLTVRTLHHYDRLGLVSPSARTEAGHRLYGEADVVRLYRVLALRQIGLSLEAIGQVLAGDAPLEPLLDRHREYLDDRITALRTLRAQLGTVLTAVRRDHHADVTDFLDLIRKVTTVDETMQKYFDRTQLAALAERREQLGEDTIAGAERAWQVLIPRVRAAVAAGMDPGTPEAREMAREWMGLLEQFHGGDSGLRDSMYRMYEENAARIEQEFCGPDQELIDFITRANATA
ncbi:MerR family transcriptional regulator [Actinokineospora sp. PR83]|uniref:MerR family transcriptional regulator n=1 Tax=Actinokineospora sp. PR83 TaxID=2884908 RepID=UPI0027E09555|nr:MerR family transcriptional regulator [Actinokineospora sp. PR83]MCG8914277.1 MerR family transcriptional regulator [Actinokineospora sp. PR83]